MSKNHRHIEKNIGISQNFLTSAALGRRIVHFAKLTPQDHVLEIGPGKGHITRHLLSGGSKVTAIELDYQLYKRLSETFRGTENLRLLHEDFLKWALPKTPFKVFANIPFNRTTDIIHKITASSMLLDAWLVTEKGAAKRFMGKPAETRASLLLKPFYSLEIRYHFQRNDFHPSPSVDCVLLHLKPKAQQDLPSADLPAYRHFLSRCFDNSGGGIHSMLTHRQIKVALKKEGLCYDIRSANMKYVQWLCLFRCSQKFGKK